MKVFGLLLTLGVFVTGFQNCSPVAFGGNAEKLSVLKNSDILPAAPGVDPETGERVDDVKTPEADNTSKDVVNTNKDVVDTGKEVIADTGKEVVVDTGKEVVVDTGKGGAETGKEIVDTTKDVVVDTGKGDAGTAKDIVVDTGKNTDTAKDVVVDTGKGNTDTAKDVVTDTDKGNPETGKDLVVDTGKGNTDAGKEVVADTGKNTDATKEVVVDTGKGNTDAGKEVVDSGKGNNSENNKKDDDKVAEVDSKQNTPAATPAPTATPAPSHSRVTFPVKNHCSDSKSVKLMSNAMVASSLELQILRVSKKKEVVCRQSGTSQIKDDFRNKKVTFESCTLPADGPYKLAVIDQNGKDLVVSNGTFQYKNGVLSNLKTQVLVDSNPKQKINLKGLPPYSGISCDLMASPLYVDFRANSRDTDVLSAPEDGVMFDILGANGEPAYSKNQISWFQKGKFALVTLPNEKGEVLGIDQLFGDNTKGADGRFAENGFLALAKHDKNKDGKIDKSDAVFDKLRLWFDNDRDGKAKRSELATFKSRGIASIDLAYDDQFSEVDQYGNEITYKSVVHFVNKQVRAIFDIWFILE